jgi:hypothetical protein
MGDTSSRASYRYNQLKNWDLPIRLLTLYPSSSEGSTIKCSLVQHSLDSKPAYEALSYTWGHPDDICSIPIDLEGHPASIMTNLEAALRVLRYVDHPRVLWIDALCINQSDGPEKEKQVAMMGTIFERAQNVVIWLGPESEDSNLAMTTISNLRSVADLETITIEQPAWIAWENLFSRPWFSRIWVLQEFKRGKNLLFQCGYACFNWDEIGKVLQEMFDGERLLCDKGHHVKLLGDVGKVVSMISTRIYLPLDASLLDGRDAARHLTTILRTYGILGSSVAHDKIYGLLGLSDAFTLLNLNSPGIHYDQPVEEVYTDWARFLIQKQGDLGLLYITQRMEHDPALPSWAPDWRKPRQDFPLTLDTFQDVFKFAMPITTGFDITPRFTSRGNILLVSGYILATLDPSIELLNAESATYIAAKLKTTSQKNLLLVCLLRGCKIKNATRKIVLLKSIVLPLLILIVKDLATMGIVHGRQQFRSSTGCTGLIPLVAREGDVICMLGNAKVPFVLRPIGDRYQLIGDAYIDVVDNFRDSYVVQEFAIE